PRLRPLGAPPARRRARRRGARPRDRRAPRVVVSPAGLSYGGPTPQRGGSMIKVYGIPRSRAARVLWMLEELQVPYELVPVSFIGDCRKPEYLKINPNGHIPALQDGDLTLFESLAINLYLARKYDKGLWPKTVEGEAKAYQWSIWAMTELEEPLLAVLMNRAFLPENQRDAKKAADGAERFKTPLNVLEGQLTSDWLA